MHIVANSESIGLHGKEAGDNGYIDRDDARTVDFFAARSEEAYEMPVHAAASYRVGKPVPGRVVG